MFLSKYEIFGVRSDVILDSVKRNITLLEFEKMGGEITSFFIDAVQKSSRRALSLPNKSYSFRNARRILCELATQRILRVYGGEP